MVDPSSLIPNVPSNWHGPADLSNPQSMLILLKSQLSALPPSEDPNVLSVYWSMYLSYLSLKSICDSVCTPVVDVDERARKCIVVVSNLQESAATKPSDRVADDRKSTTELLDCANVETGFITTQRLGQPNGNRPRLMKIFFNDQESAGKALTKLARYKRDNRQCKLSFRPSLTREEREERRKLNQRCQEQRAKAKAEGLDDDYVIYADEVVLRKDIGLVKGRLKKSMLTGANSIPLGTRHKNSPLPTAEFAWLDAARIAAENLKTTQSIPPIASTSSNMETSN